VTTRCTRDGEPEYGNHTLIPYFLKIHFNIIQIANGSSENVEKVKIFGDDSNIS
jgi:hypothetical protein